jgi:hypothetical protein
MQSTSNVTLYPMALNPDIMILIPTQFITTSWTMAEAQYIVILRQRVGSVLVTKQNKQKGD